VGELFLYVQRLGLGLDVVYFFIVYFLADYIGEWCTCAGQF